MGHLGVHKCPCQSQGMVYWPGLRKDVENWRQQCEDCAETKSPSTFARGPFNPGTFSYPMERIVLDVFGHCQSLSMEISTFLLSVTILPIG